MLESNWMKIRMYIVSAGGGAILCHPLNKAAFFRRIDREMLFPFPHIPGHPFTYDECVPVGKRAWYCRIQAPSAES